MKSILATATAVALTLTLLGCPPGEDGDARGAGPDGSESPVADVDAASEASTTETSTETSEASTDASSTTEVATAVSACTCDTAKEDNGWCADCDVGYLHRAKHECKDCVTAATSAGGWCSNCDIGYVKGQKTKCEGCAAKGDVCEACAQE